jgi:predicted PurR-regulated permease PerM
MVVAGFFTITLYPVVAWVQRRLSCCPRWLATLLVFLLVFLLLAGLLTVFAVPLAPGGDPARRAAADDRGGRPRRPRPGR